MKEPRSGWEVTRRWGDACLPKLYAQAGWQSLPRQNEVIVGADPASEALAGMSPYQSMGNNPILYSDPDGDFIPVLVAAAAVIGAGQNVYSNWDKILQNSLSAIGYATTGAIGGGVSVANPALGRIITAGGNMATDIAAGNIPKFESFGDFAGYAAGTTLDAIAVGGSGSLAKMGFKGLNDLGFDWATDVVLDNPEYFLESVITYGPPAFEGSSVLEVFETIRAVPINIFAAQSLSGVGIVAGSSLGITNSPQLPEKTIINQNGVKVEHYYKAGDHGPAHAHVKGGGPETKISQNGHPLKGNLELTAQQRKVIMQTDNRRTIRKSMKKIMKWYRKAK